MRDDAHVGRSVGLLYFANTLGGALGCFAAAVLLLGLLGQRAAVQGAAAVNVALGAAVLLLRGRLEVPA